MVDNFGVVFFLYLLRYEGLHMRGAEVDTESALYQQSMFPTIPAIRRVYEPMTNDGQ